MSVRHAFLETADVVRPLLDEPGVVEGWDGPSALPRMTIGALTAHLTRAILTVDTYLDQTDPGLSTDLLTAAGYYTSIDGLTTRDGPDLDDPLHVAVRERALSGAASGPEVVSADWDEGLLHLHAALATEPATRTVSVLGGRRMMLDDYLITRLIELVVHADDLATSIAVPTPEFTPEANAITIDCLTAVAVERHGALAVVRAMARTERDTVKALRVL